MVTALTISLIICSFIFLTLAIGSMYVIGLFNTRVAKRVDLILFTITHLRPSHKNARHAPKKLIKLARALIYKRRLFINKIKYRRLRKEIEQKTRTN